MQTSGANIQAIGTNPISASNTIRWKVFGAATDVTPLNQTVASPMDANTDIVSINNSIRGQLGADIRGNYIFSGATWTFGGAAPIQESFIPPAANNSNQVGTSFLTNSTMETYQQGVDSTFKNGGSNCFMCHNNGGSSLNPDVEDGLSHIYFFIQSLP